MTRNELAECINIAKSRFKNLFDVDTARGWADMEYELVRNYLLNSIPETIMLRGMNGEYIKRRHEEELERERESNFNHYGLRYTDEELTAHKDEFLEAQRNVNYRVFKHRWTDDELILEHWTEVFKNDPHEDTGD